MICTMLPIARPWSGCNLLCMLLLIIPFVLGRVHKSDDQVNVLESIVTDDIDNTMLLTTGRDWISLSQSVQFQPADADHSPALRRAQGRFLSADYSEQVVDGSETVYSTYSQAWRLLGIYVDCSNKNNQRRLDQQYAAACPRYLLWAAYVDLEYEGGGLGEYQIYNTQTGTWDNTACKTSGTKRCVKMDCHLPSTRFALLGFFKQEYPMEFLQTLFKRQGSCSWDQSTYKRMMGPINWLPEQCTASATYDDNNNLLYYDLVPLQGGNVGVGLYTDNYCTVTYTGSKTVDTVIKSTTGANSLQGFNKMKQWNHDLSAFQICHPCRTFDLSHKPSGTDDAVNNANDPDHGYFLCKDQAGGSGVNQCSLFQQTGHMHKAALRDVAVASQQGSIVRSYAADVTPGPWQRNRFLFLALAVFVVGVTMFVTSGPKRRRIASETNNEPFI